MSIQRKLRHMTDRNYWLRDTEKGMVRIAESLVEKGFSEDEACALIQKMWALVAAEYGE